jgi:hypothetical protein
METGHEFPTLIGTPVMSAINTLSAMGFSCKDVSREVLRPSLKIAGILHCTKQATEANIEPLFIVLPFSEDGIILDVIQTKTSNPS